MARWCSFQRSYQQGVSWLFPSPLWLHPHRRVHTGPLQPLLPGNTLLQGRLHQSHWYQNVRCGVSDYLCLLEYMCTNGGRHVVDSQGTFPGPCTPYRSPPGNLVLELRIGQFAIERCFIFLKHFFFYLCGLFIPSKNNTHGKKSKIDLMYRISTDTKQIKTKERLMGKGLLSLITCHL